MNSFVIIISQHFDVHVVRSSAVKFVQDDLDCGATLAFKTTEDEGLIYVGTEKVAQKIARHAASAVVDSLNGCEPGGSHAVALSVPLIISTTA